MPDGIDAGGLAGLVLVLALAGGLTGLLAGLFGVGGGAITVPILFEAFRLTGIEDAVGMPLAVGTSLAIIVPTSIRSTRAHLARGTIDTGLLRAWAAPILAGVLAGAVIARQADPWVFQAVFVAVAGVIAAKLLLGRADWRLAADMPHGPVRQLYGLAIGLLAALMGVGGGAISTLAMTLHGRPIHQAVATSAGVGVLISIPGALGYMAAGWGRAGLPPDAIGFVSVLGFALMVPTSLLTARIGVDLAHRLSRRRLEVLFGLFLLAVCLRFLAALLV